VNRIAAVLVAAAAVLGASANHKATERAPLKPFLGLPPALDDAGTGFPRLLSKTAIFADLAALRPIAGIAAYTVNQPLWSDGASKQRWLAVPNDGAPYSADERIAVDHAAAWRFPRGTVFIKHFAMPVDLRHPDGPQRRLETRLLAVRRQGEVYGVTYRWRPDGSDAELLTDTASDDIAVTDEQGKPATIAWTYPSPAQCMSCHTRESGGVLGVNTRQLNRAATPGGTNQLVQLGKDEWFDRPIAAGDVAALPRLRALDDADADLPTRIRSYLDANCSSCHQPGSRVGDTAFGLDLRFVTPLERQGVVDGEAHNPLGIAQGRILVGKHAERSVLLDRVSRRGDPFAMPPLGSGRVDAALVAQLRRWIEELPVGR
jgi:mono/diheme cytochrome c family protein